LTGRRRVETEKRSERFGRPTVDLIVARKAHPRLLVVASRLQSQEHFESGYLGDWYEVHLFRRRAVHAKDVGESEVRTWSVAVVRRPAVESEATLQNAGCLALHPEKSIPDLDDQIVWVTLTNRKQYSEVAFDERIKYGRLGPVPFKSGRHRVSLRTGSDEHLFARASLCTRV
jgi:hypothetical protein